MKKRRIARLLMILLALCALSLASGASESASTAVLEGYFTEKKYVRPVMEAGFEFLWTVEPFERVSCEPVNEKWGKTVSADGLLTGYLYYKDMLPLPEVTPCAPYEAYAETKQSLRSLPFPAAPETGVLSPRTCCRVEGGSGEWLRITLRNGSSGFVPKANLLKAVFQPQTIAPLTFLVGETLTGSSLPLLDAEPSGTLSPGTFYTARRAVGTWLEVAEEGCFIPQSAVRCCGDPEEFFALADGVREGPAVELLFMNAELTEDAPLVFPDGTEDALPAGQRVFAYEAFGGYVSASLDGKTGYLREKSLRVMDGEALRAALAEKDLSGAGLSRNIFLDEAFALLEESNPFLLRYNLVTGADVRPLMRLGIPYFWGGRNLKASLERAPLYTTRAAWQSSPVYYRKGTVYAYGLDCVGFVKLVYKLAGHPIETSMEDLMGWPFCHADRHVFCGTDRPLPSDWAECAEALEPGDVLVVHHPGLHVMLYIGTLRDYGYTAEELPDLAKYLDYPLMIHCGENPYYYLRFSALIAGTDDEKLKRATPPDGGVSVSLLGADPADAQMVIRCALGSWPCFDVEGTCVTAFDFSAVTSYCFWRETPVRASP